MAHLLPAGAPITVAVDDTLLRRRGKKVHGAGWFHDGSAAGQVKLGYGNNWIVVAIVVTLPFCTRPVALPVLATLAVKGGERSKPDLARDLVDALAASMFTAPGPHRRHCERFGRVEHSKIAVRQGGNVIKVRCVKGIVWIPALTGTHQLRPNAT